MTNNDFHRKETAASIDHSCIPVYSTRDILEHVLSDDYHSVGFKVVGILKLIGSRVARLHSKYGSSLCAHKMSLNPPS